MKEKYLEDLFIKYLILKDLFLNNISIETHF